MTSTIKQVVRKEWSKVTQLMRRKKKMKGFMLPDGRVVLCPDEKTWVMQMWERRNCIVNRYNMREGK